jgi:hypothetical protein
MLNEELKKNRKRLSQTETSNDKEESVNEKLGGISVVEKSPQSTPNEGGTCRKIGEVEEDEVTTPDRVCLIEGGHGHGQGRSVDSRDFFLGDA